jgi:hypothetical protein
MAIPIVLVFLPIGGTTAVILLLESSPSLRDRSYLVLALGYPATGHTSDLHWRDISRGCSNVSGAYIAMGCEYKGMGQ